MGCRPFASLVLRPVVTGSLSAGPALLAVFMLLVSLPAQAPLRSPIGLKNRWYATGGSGSHSGVVATAPLDVAPERAWQFVASGRILGEPLVWDDIVVFECELPKGKRRVQVVGLDDGAPLVHKDFFAKEAPDPLAPAIWNRELVVRAGGKLKRYRIGTTSITEQRVSAKAGRPGPPLRIDNAIYLLVGDRVERWSADKLEREWRSGGNGFRGDIVVAADGVFAVRTVEVQHRGLVGELVQLHRGTGAAVGRVLLPTKAVGAPQLTVGDFAIVVHGLDRIPLQDGNSIDALQYTLPLPGGEASPDVAAAMPVAPVIFGNRWIGGCGTAAAPRLGLGKKNSKMFRVLAAKGSHDYLLSSPVTLAGHLAYFSGVAVDIETLEVRWRIDAPARARAIAARDSLLYKHGDKIVAFRRAGADDAAVTLARRREWGALHEKARHSELQQLVAAAIMAREMKHADELLRRCRALGVDERWVKQQVKLRKSRSRIKPKKDPARLPRMQRQAAAVDALAVTALWRELEGAELAADDWLRALRFVHDVDPEYPALGRAVAALVPDELRPSGKFDAGEWLGFVEGTRAIPIDFLAVPPVEKAGTVTPDQLKLLELRRTWRKDILAVQSPRLLVYTPVEAPGGLARCLSLGELVCDTLEAMFADYPVVREDPRRMRILLYPTEREYKKFSPGGGHLAWTSGHYSPSEQLSRMFLPKDQEAFTRVMEVFVHELTHQWLQDRCPAIDARRAAAHNPEQAGYWVVEGFASFVEEFAFDLDRRTHRTDSARDENLDILGHAAATMRLPWSDVLKFSPLEFHRTSPVPQHDVKLGYRLGMSRQLSPRNFFYAQSGALCHWLWHAEAGKRKKALLDYVLAHYQGESAKLDLAKNLGLSAEAIGAAVAEYAAARNPSAR